MYENGDAYRVCTVSCLPPDCPLPDNGIAETLTPWQPDRPLAPHVLDPSYGEIGDDSYACYHYYTSVIVVILITMLV